MVSVCMATYNGEMFIKPQLESILAQLNTDDEVIISDDGSTDQTISILESIDDERIKIYHNRGEKGFCGNFENALKLAKGDYIFLSDQDDIWLPGKYQEMSLLLDKYDLVVSNSVLTDERLQVINPSFFSIFNSGKGIIKNIIRNTYYGSCMAFRRNIRDIALPFPKTKEIGHDIWLGLVAEIKGSVIFYDKPLLLYRRHKDAFCSLTESGAKSTRPFLLKILGRFIILWEIAKFLVKMKKNRNNAL